MVLGIYLKAADMVAAVAKWVELLNDYADNFDQLAK